MYVELPGSGMRNMTTYGYRKKIDIERFIENHILHIFHYLNNESNIHLYV